MQTACDILKERPQGEVNAVLPGQSVLSVAQYMKYKNVGAVAVMKDNVLHGVISERDILNKIVGPGLDPRDVTASEVMTTDLTFAGPDENATECLIKMRRAHCRHLPVLEQGGHFLGLLSLRDVLGSDEEELLDRYLWERDTRRNYSAASVS